nr:hypothetical protein [Candidatus Cloacimonadota bacterium]
MFCFSLIYSGLVHLSWVSHFILVREMSKELETKQIQVSNFIPILVSIRNTVNDYLFANYKYGMLILLSMRKRPIILQKYILTKKWSSKTMQQLIRYEQRWGRSSVWLERLPVTQKVASSSLVAPAIFLGRPIRRPFSYQ